MTDRNFRTALNAAELMLNGLGEAMATRVAKQWEDKCRELADARAQVERLTTSLKSVSTQCGNVIYNCEQRPANNERHLSSWRGVKEFADGALAQHPSTERNQDGAA